MSAPVTVAFATLGCRLNQVESQEMGGLLESRGFRTVSADEPAQVYVVNTCTVTGRADFSDRQLIRRVSRRNPAALLVVTGCYAQTDAQAVARIPGVDLVLGNQEKYRLPDLLADLVKRARPEIRVADIAGARDVPVAPFAKILGRSRAFVKIQDGCQHRCAFCIVPVARGGSRSQEPKVVLDQIRGLVEAGYRDITLTGVDIGHWGWDLFPRSRLADLVVKAAEVPGLRWLRLSSVLPAYFTAELIDVVTSSPAVAPHLHLPLQSGSDRVLRLMRRPYNVAMYRRLVERLAGAIPDLGLGADVIVGHPGELEEDFDATMALVGSLPFSYLHVFPYSDRKGTEAALRPGHVPAPLIRQRSARLRALAREKNLAFRRRMVGQRRDVVVLAERERETGRLVGLTGNYVEVAFDGPDDLARRFVAVTVRDASAERTLASLEEPAP
ncbi:MAG TPA: tRNA (N(6)-L-threonylcarbamoyladenosine(37)-C(2))-methylthiotransferase MtaB [Methylomirabilota bacterium]|jgi:threonylcarbamoyladenosine tRNA methylthiotransferase MtaB|nr:tRNA (N(6)-L-threonylcarbamoyladenosine(37)-C(2))-methylthiotransferase MtaB [Methylomirabilota bacterium]